MSTIGTGVIDCQVCVRANGKTSAHLKSSVQNVHRVHEVERKLEDVDSTAWPLYRWAPGGHVPTLRSGAISAGRRHVAAVHTILQLPPNLVVDWVKVRTVGWPQSCSDEVWCFMSLKMHCLTCSVGWTPECLTAVCDAILETEYFVVNIWILVTRIINNIFLWNLALLLQIYS